MLHRVSLNGFSAKLQPAGQCAAAEVSTIFNNMLAPSTTIQKEPLHHIRTVSACVTMTTNDGDAFTPVIKQSTCFNIPVVRRRVRISCHDSSYFGVARLVLECAERVRLLTEHRCAVVDVNHCHVQRRSGRQRRRLALVEGNDAQFERRPSVGPFKIQCGGSRHESGLTIDGHERMSGHGRRHSGSFRAVGLRTHLEVAQCKLDTSVVANVQVAGDEPDEWLTGRQLLGDGTRIRGAFETRRVVVSVRHTYDEVT